MATVTEGQIRSIYGETIDALYGYVSRRCGGDRALTEDITQETWLRAVAEWRSKGLPDHPVAWLTTVARNLLLNQLRRHRTVSLDPNDIIAAADSGSVSDSADVARVVQSALTRMPRREARMLEAFHFDGHRVAQIAATHGLSERAVEGRLRRARMRLRRHVEELLATGEGIR